MSERLPPASDVTARTDGWRVAVAAWMAVVAVVSLLPEDAIAPVPRTASLVWHAAAYAVLTYLLMRSRVRVWRAAVGAWSYGALIEALQTLSPGRALEVVDVVANAVGAAVAASLIRAWDRVHGGSVGRSV